jgi:hypothetical protein
MYLRKQGPGLVTAADIEMGRDVLMSHRDQWVKEASPTSEHLGNLTPGEADLYESLAESEFGDNVRLEQEPVRFHLLETELNNPQEEFLPSRRPQRKSVPPSAPAVGGSGQPSRKVPEHRHGDGGQPVADLVPGDRRLRHPKLRTVHATPAPHAPTPEHTQSLPPTPLGRIWGVRAALGSAWGESTT